MSTLDVATASRTLPARMPWRSSGSAISLMPASPCSAARSLRKPDREPPVERPWSAVAPESNRHRRGIKPSVGLNVLVVRAPSERLDNAPVLCEQELPYGGGSGQTGGIDPAFAGVTADAVDDREVQAIGRPGNPHPPVELPYGVHCSGQIAEAEAVPAAGRLVGSHPDERAPAVRCLGLGLPTWELLTEPESQGPDSEKDARKPVVPHHPAPALPLSAEHSA